MRRLIAIAGLIAFASPAAANGILSGYACGAMPASYQIDIEVADDSAQMLKIRDSAIAALKRKQARISGTAELVLSIDILTVREGAVRKKRDLGSVTDGSSERIRARMNLWSNKSDSIIGGRRDGFVKGALDEVRVEITVNDKSNGKCIWRGEAHHGSAGEDQWIIAEKSALQLIDALGQDIRDWKFEID
jgi:hypothetical protein